MRRLLILLASLAALCAPMPAATFYLSPDVPTTLGANTYVPWDIVRNDSGVYSLIATLPAGTPINALHRLCTGDWLLSVGSPMELPPGSGALFEPLDVIHYDGGIVYSHYFCGAGLGIAPGSKIDAAYLVGGDSSNLVLSFDAPTTIGAITAEPADLVEYQRVSPGCNGWALVGHYFDASTSAPPVPLSSITTGADTNGSLTVASFDVPTTLGLLFTPGELASWNGLAFGTYAFDPAWPLGSRIDAMSFLPDPGRVPVLNVRKSLTTVGDLDLSWAPATSAGADDYGIYEGSLTSPWAYTHGAITCTDVGADRLESITPAASHTYYLVVPWNPDAEGSYGKSSAGSERPLGTGPCATPQGLSCP
jgi:hypothetical protein